MKKILIGTIILFWVFSSIPPSTVVYIHAQNAPEPTIKELIAYYGDLYGVSRKTLYRTIKCESSFNPKAHNKTEKEDSWGLSQINLKVHKNITKAQALDPDYSIDYLAKNIKQGNGDMWTCYKES